MRDNTYAVIMAGGKGERFWPLSTSKHPKQVLSLIGDKSLLAQSIERIAPIIPPERVIVITSDDLVDITCAAAPELKRENVIGEPIGRDTAAACALASAIVKAKCPDGLFGIMTADHIIGDLDVFSATIEESFDIAAENDCLITIGIKPTFPSTGFGYIESAENVEHNGTVDFLKAVRFVEKPDADTAQDYIKAGNYCWNSGMFIWSTQSFQNALASFQPHLLEMADTMSGVYGTDKFDSQLKEEYDKLDKISVDYAIMEKADNIIMAKGTFEWHDVGAWPALADHFDKDSGNNTLIGDCESIDSKGNIVVSSDHLTAIIGVEDIIVVQADGVTLICPKDRAQDVKAMVNKLRDSGNYDKVL